MLLTTSACKSVTDCLNVSSRQTQSGVVQDLVVSLAGSYLGRPCDLHIDRKQALRDDVQVGVKRVRGKGRAV